MKEKIVTEFSGPWKEFRVNNLMSQPDMGKALGMCTRAIQGIEWGEHNPSFKSQIRFRDFKKKIESAKLGDE